MLREHLLYTVSVGGTLWICEVGELLAVSEPT